MKKINVLAMADRFMPAPAVPAPAGPAVGMTDRENRLLAEILASFKLSQESRGYQEDSILRDLFIIADYVGFSGKAPWNCDEDDFHAWCKELGVNRKVKHKRKPGLAVSTQRMYQGLIRRFYDYMVNTLKFRNAIAMNFGVRVRQICENCIPHVLDRELASERPAMSRKEVKRLFEQLRRDIAEAEQFGGKDAMALKRDYALFYTYYASGFRAQEGLQLRFDSFSEHPELPELGSYGIARIWRKGSKGSGPKCQEVCMTLVGLRGVLDWYRDEVYPWYADRLKDANSQVMFLSERGRQLGYSAADGRFKLALRRAGLDTSRYSLHSLRHTMATHEINGLSIHAVSLKLGHKLLTTTLRYLHCADQQLLREMIKSAKLRLKAARD